MRRLLVFTLFVFTSSIVFGQLDSLSIVHYNIRESVWENFTLNPSTFQQLNFDDFTETSLYTSIKKQPISKIQTPNKVQYYGFRGKGIFSLNNKLKLFGNLDFSRSYAQESSYLLMHNISEEFSKNVLQSPNYPLAITSGDTENQHYKLMGGFSGVLLKKMPFSVKLNYNVEKFFGLTIPKTEQEVLDYNGTFQLGYQLNRSLVYGILELRRSQNNFAFNAPSTNSASIISLVEPQTYAGFSVGYGDVLGFNAALLEGFIENNTFLIGGGYNFKKDSHLFDINYTYKDSKEKYFSTVYNDDSNLAAVFNSEELNLNVNYVKHSENQLLIVSAKGVLAEGINTHVFENFIENETNRTAKQNYKQELEKLSVDVEWFKLDKENITLGLKYTTQISNNSIIDLNTTDKQITYWNNAISFNKDFIVCSKSFINVEVGMSYYLPLNEFLDYSFANSSTSTGVSIIPITKTIGSDLIINDHIYDNTHKIGQSLAINYQFKLHKGQVATIVADYSFLQAFNTAIFNKENKVLGVSFNLQY